MLQRLKKLYFKVIQRMPGNRVRADYFEMLQKLKQLEGQVEGRAQQLELAKASFLRNLYHEIRTPLNAIVGFTHLLTNEQKLDKHDKLEYQDQIIKSSGDFLKIMDDIIQASLLEAGMVNMNNEPLCLNDFMDEVYALGNVRKHVLEKTQVALLKNYPETKEKIYIMCDRYYLNQIMVQLIDNAFKFTEKGTIEFGCDIRNQDIEFYVKDTGLGDINGKGKYVFSKFTKVDVTDSAKNGLGIGLSNCKSLVNLMKGKIWYTSKAGKGTSFYFSIPYVAAENPGEDEKSQNFLEGVFREQKTLAV